MHLKLILDRYTVFPVLMMKQLEEYYCSKALENKLKVPP